MNVLQDPTKKTSINSLLNPQEVSGYPHISSIGPPSVVQVQGSSQIHSYDSDYPPSSFNLRAASWETPGDSRKSVNAPPVQRTYYHQTQQPPLLPHGPSSSYSYSPSRPAESRVDDGRNYSDREPMWQPSHQQHHQSDSSNMSYGHVRSNERSALAGDYSNTPSTYNSAYAGPPDPSVWQSSHRASVRIAAKGTLPNTSQTVYDDRYDQTSYYGHHHQDVYSPPVENYPPQSQEITVVPPPTQSESAVPSTSTSSSSSKRKQPESGAAPAPKPKRPRAKAKPSGSETPSATPGASKRGYNAKKRSEAALISAQNDALQRAQLERAPDSGPNPSTAADGPVSLVPELQFARCMSNRYKNEEFPRCVSCTRRWAGDTCRFQGIRYFMRDSQRRLYGISFTEHHSQQAGQASPMEFPTKWNRKFEKEHICRTKLSIAKALLPTLLIEQEHLKVNQIVRRPRESEVRATCDTCMTSLFSTSFMCRLCGREVCNECFQQVKALTSRPPNPTPTELSMLALKREKFANANPFFLTCTKRNDHGVDDFTPVTRFVKSELDKSIKEMREILDKEAQPVQACEAPESAGHPSRPRSGEDLPSILLTTPPQPNDLVQIRSSHTDSFNYGRKEAFSDPLNSPVYDDYTPSNAPAHTTEIPIYPLQVIPASLYDPPIVPSSAPSPVFSDLWLKGLPLLVKDVLPRFKINWSPKYFMERYGDQTCLVVECQTDANKRVSVKEFFGWFGAHMTALNAGS
ncbi:hypothetical protein CPB84DRAFT_1847865 [Gymnopilus junonius]|uniref:Uncharacterized protein n=1 Tax=Gymnopilus junonius TaxID=109634 RepID=A0A9P5NLE6_GYMJU|nr:hypothetical protein CPB84DRAFT_1847865 [Gymnopilus junonius]